MKRAFLDKPKLFEDRTCTTWYEYISPEYYPLDLQQELTKQTDDLFEYNIISVLAIYCLACNFVKPYCYHAISLTPSNVQKVVDRSNSLNKQ